MIQFEHVYKTYPNGYHALRNLNFEVYKSEFVFLTGPSGAGKSTLFRLLALYDTPTSGSIHVRGQDLSKIPAKEIPYYRRRIGMVFQDFKLLQDRTILENVALPLQILGHKPPRNKILNLLEEFGIQEKADDYPLHLSGGEQQRAAIARALIHQPEILIADEPTGNLDPNLSQEIMGLFDLANARGTTLLIATHDLEMVKRKQKRTLRLNSGQMIDLATGGLNENLL